MSQNDNRDPNSHEDGVALSPYDDDLAPATEPPAPAPAPADEVVEPEDGGTAAPHAPEWQPVREAPADSEPVAADAADNEDTPEMDDPTSDAAARLPFDETAGREQAYRAADAAIAAAAEPVAEEQADPENVAGTVDAAEADSLDETVSADAIADDLVEADALADETLDDEDVETSTYHIPEPDPLSDTAVRRTSLLRPADAEADEAFAAADLDAAPPVIPDDERASEYGPADSDLFAGATYDKVPSRAGAHWWSLLLTVILTPVTWYLLTDAGARMTLPNGAAWEIGTVNLAAIAELGAGLLLLFLIMLAARASSLGVFVTGILLSVVGGAFLFAPAWTDSFIEPIQDWLRSFNPGLGGNLAHHLEWDGASGRIFVVGIGLIFVAMVSHFARRRGRDEEKIRNAIALRRTED